MLIVLKVFFYNNLICYVFVSINLKQTFRIFKILFCFSENQTEINLEIIIKFQTLMHINTLFSFGFDKFSITYSFEFHTFITLNITIYCYNIYR